MLSEFEGQWTLYINAIYDRFCQDFVFRKAVFRGRRVTVRKEPPTDGKEYGFWHCVSEGRIENERTPDMARCERIGWIAAIIAHPAMPGVDYWEENNRGQHDHLLWFNEEFVIVLSERGKTSDGGPDAYLLKTAFCTTREHQKRKKRAARDDWKKTNAASFGDGA
jgi:hypothetical protein